jgi:Tfp pilus assembly protein PilF
VPRQKLNPFSPLAPLAAGEDFDKVSKVPRKNRGAGRWFTPAQDAAFCYMEVAVITLHSSVYRQLFLAAAGAGLLMSVFGCNTDMITYSQQSQHQGLSQLNDGDYVDATGSFQNAVRQDPTNYKAHFYLGECYEMNKQYDLAAHSYKASLDEMAKTLPGREDTAFHEQAMDRFARLLADADPNQAQTDLLLKQAQESRSGESYRIIARAFRYRSDADSAIQNYRTALLMAPHDFAINKEYGLYLIQLKQSQGAVTLLREAYRQDQNDPQVNAALRQLGITPDDSLMFGEAEGSKPVILHSPLDSNRTDVVGSTDQSQH